MAKDLRSKLAVVGLTSMVFAGGLIGLSSLASADTAPVQPAQAIEVDEAEDVPLNEELSVFDEYNAEDQELILEFENCLTESGLTDLEGDLDEAEAIDIDGIFEECEVVLGDLSFPADDWLELEELSTEDEAIFDEYDACIDEALGDDIHSDIDIDADWSDEELEAFEDAIAGCEELLDDLSFDLEAAEVLVDGEWLEGDWEDGEWAEGEWEDGEWPEGEWIEADEFELSEEDEALFDEFDACLADTAGIELDVEGDWTDDDFEALEAAFETCEPILDGVNGNAGFLIIEGDEELVPLDA